MSVSNEDGVQAGSRRLFDRTPRGYQFTKAGQVLLTYAESMEAQSIGLYQDVSGQDATLTGTVRIAATEGLAIEFLARHIHRFRAIHPDIVIKGGFLGSVIKPHETIIGGGARCSSHQ